MSPFDTFMFDWFGDTLVNVLLFNHRRGRAGARSRPATPWPSPGGRGGRSSSIPRFFRRCCAFSTMRWAAASCGRSAASCSAGLVQLAVAAFAYRLTRARLMVRQYPWLYQRKGLLGWEERH